MKKIFTLSIALMAIFYSASSQTTTIDSFYENSSYDAKLLGLMDDKGEDYGFILIYEENNKVNIFYIPADKKKAKKGSREEKKVVKLIMRAYWHDAKGKNMTLGKKLYKKRKLACIILEK